MNRLALVGAGIAVLICAAVALAADPSPSPSPSAMPAASPTATASASLKPVKSPSASATPSSSTNPAATSSPSATSGTAAQNGPSASPSTWTGDVNPVDIQGTATVTKNSNGTGTLVLQLTGMVNEQNWTVDVEPGSIQHPNDSNRIAFKQGSDVTRVSPDKIQVTLSSTEMTGYEHALATNPGGVTIFVSDGHRLSAANIPANAQ
jgi:hypothetical protein